MNPILTETNLIEELDHDIQASGYVGDTALPRLIWLVLNTRFTSRPVSLVVFGPSGSGKSFALQTALNLVASDSYQLFHGMSEKAIIYSTDLDLRHKHLILQEAAGMKEGAGRALLRQLLSEGEAKYRTVQSNEGILDAHELHVEGPTGLLMTTTATSIHEEDASRMFCVHIDEDHDQIRRVLLAQAMGKRFEVTEAISEKWKQRVSQSFSEPKDVSIEFGEALARSLPTSHFRIQRDFQSILTLISTCALLHSNQREVDSSGRIIASLDDYSIVRDLVAPHLDASLEKSVHESVRIVVEAVAALNKGARSRHSETVTQRKVAEHLGWDRSVVSRNVTTAISLGFLVDENPGQGRQSDLKLGARKLSDVSHSVLPKVPALRAELLEQ